MMQAETCIDRLPNSTCLAARLWTLWKRCTTAGGTHAAARFLEAIAACPHAGDASLSARGDGSLP